MMLPTIEALALAALAGFGLGALFYASLWWTLKRALASPRPALWQLGGMLSRMALALGGFYLVGAGQWQQLLACLLGFMLARPLVLRLSRSWTAAMPPPREVSQDRHAPQS